MPVRALSTHTVRRAVPLIAAMSALIALSGCSRGNTDDASTIVRTTTAVAGASVVGVDRDTSIACRALAPADPAGGPTRHVAGAAGDADVPADPQRIVVLSTQALDTTCELGLWERVVGAATDASGTQPSYLGTGIGQIPSIGSVTTPDPAKIAALHPDLILGTEPTDPATADKLRAIAPTVFDGVDGGWQQRFVVGATALGRGETAPVALEKYRTEARTVGLGLNSAQTQASLIRFGADSIRVEGSDTFAAQVLTDAGVRRPPSQRGQSYDLVPSDLKRAEADLIYVSFDGAAGKSHGTSVMKSLEWENLGAAMDRRVWVVDDAIWSGDGPVAAFSLLDDLRATLNGYGD